MRNNYLYWLPVLYIALFAFSGCKTKQIKGSQAGSLVTETSYNHLLWKIEGADLQTPSFLYGTIHIIPQKDFNPSDTLLHYFDQANKLVMEMDMDVMDPGMGGERHGFFRDDVLVIRAHAQTSQ